MTIAELWRYPVKTMAGERLQRARLGPLGIEGDRIVHVETADGRVLTSRSHPRFLGHKGSIGQGAGPDGGQHASTDGGTDASTDAGADGGVLVDGRPWQSPDVAADVAAIGGNGARLVRYEGAERFDVLPLLVATDGAIAAFGHDGRRLRPNIVVGGVEGLTESEWPGACLRVGDVLIGVQDLRLRCIMTSFDPDTLAQDKDITRDIYRRFDGKLALNCFVIAGGTIAVGDEVTLVRGGSCADAVRAPLVE